MNPELTKELNKELNILIYFYFLRLVDKMFLLLSNYKKCDIF